MQLAGGCAGDTWRGFETHLPNLDGKHWGVFFKVVKKKTRTIYLSNNFSTNFDVFTLTSNKNASFLIMKVGRRAVSANMRGLWLQVRQNYLHTFKHKVIKRCLQVGSMTRSRTQILFQFQASTFVSQHIKMFLSDRTRIASLSGDAWRFFDYFTKIF